MLLEKENYLMLWERVGEVNDANILQFMCNACNLHLYMEERKGETNYMISGNAFVIDIVYTREEGSEITENWGLTENQSIESSVAQVGKEKEEDIVHRKMTRVCFSLIEEVWSVYFKEFTYKIHMYLQKRKYIKLYDMIREMIKYDKEVTEENKKSFSVLAQKGYDIEGMISAKKITGVVNYSFEHHKYCIVWEGEKKQNIIYALLNETGKSVEFGGNKCTIEEAERKVSVLRTKPLLWQIMAESLLLGYLLQLEIEKDRKRKDICRVIFIDRSNIKANNRTKNECREISIDEHGYVSIDNEVNKYYTLIMKRTESMQILAEVAGFIF